MVLAGALALCSNACSTPPAAFSLPELASSEHREQREASPILGQQPDRADIRNPGPDFGDFPNSAEVVPLGRFYVETGFGFAQASDPDTRGYGPAVLYRVGVVQDLELRVGATLLHEDEPDDVTGLGPLELGFKYHLRDGSESALEPALGIELQALLPTATADLDDGKVLPSGTLNVDHDLPADFTFCWNAGFCTSVDDDGDLFFQGDFQWSLGYDIDGPAAGYVTGFSNYPADPSSGSAASVVGFDFEWFLTERIVFNALYGAGMTDDSPDDTVQLSLSFAF